MRRLILCIGQIGKGSKCCVPQCNQPFYQVLALSMMEVGSGLLNFIFKLSMDLPRRGTCGF